jgi:chromate transport protein ChrA
MRQAPRLSYLELFKRFLWFGARAFGGPFAQIQMMKQELVIDENWVDVDRFIRVFAVYQALPGPEVLSAAHLFPALTFFRRLSSLVTLVTSLVDELDLSLEG